MYLAYEFHGGMGTVAQRAPLPVQRTRRVQGLPLQGDRRRPGAPGQGQFVTVKAWPDPMSTLSGIAAHFGIADWSTIWDDPHNAGLRAHRVNPDHVQPGDAVWVPA